MFCTNCGRNLRDNAAFCEYCGAQINQGNGVNPQYQGNPNQIPIRTTAAPKKAFPLKYILIPTGILAATAVLIAVLVTVLKPSESVPVGSGYVQQPGGNTGGNTGGNAGGNTQLPVSEEKYTSPKTGNEFAIPEKGRASVSLNGIEKIMPAQNTECNLDVLDYNNYFDIYFDGIAGTSSSLNISYHLSEGSDWKAGKTYSFDELKSQDCNDITADGFYTDKYGDAMFSWAQYGNVFKDAQFTIIDRNSSTGEMKWYFYVKMSADNSTNIVEGVAHTVYGEKTTSVSDSYLENGGGNTGGNTGGGTGDINLACLICGGSGKCRSCIGGRCIICNGKGYKEVPDYGTGIWNKVDCSGCDNGKCHKCNGTGKCSACGGN